MHTRYGERLTVLRATEMKAIAILRPAGYVLLLILMALSARAEESVLLAGMHVSVWSPNDGGRHPLIVFSHGLHGCSTQAGFLMRAFAAAGYLVLAPDHRDAGCRGGADEPPQAPLREPEQWSETTYRDRAQDIQRLLQAVSIDERFSAGVDLSRVGLVGHSLGGYTVLGLSGGWPSWRMPGVKAVLGLSPYLAPFLARHTLQGLAAPVMYQGGTLDLGLTPAVRRLEGGYDQSPSPKYYVEFDQAGHFAWTDVGGSDREPITRYSVAFMNRYVKGEADDPVLLRAGPGVTSFRYALPGAGDTPHSQEDASH
jgi:predicted dienelactone hydrolase